MGWTFAHPAAALPLRFLCPRYLSFPALVAGCIAPDLGYYTNAFALASFAHKPAGSVLVCLPSGFMLLAGLALLKRPLWFVLPGPHRQALAPLVATRIDFGPYRFLVAAASIVLGAWTHSLWDSFTHYNAWAVQMFDVLRAPIFTFAGKEIQLFYALQWLSTLLGVAALAVGYGMWLKRRGVKAASLLPKWRGEDRWRWLAIIAAIGISLTVALIVAIPIAEQGGNAIALRRAEFSGAVAGTKAFVIAILTIAVIAYSKRSATAKDNP